MNLSHGRLLPVAVLVAFTELTVTLGLTAIWCTFSFANCTLFTKESLFLLSCNCFEVFAFLNFHLIRFRCYH